MVLFCLLPWLFSGCGKGINCCVIKTPAITFTSERTSLESQILGTYKEIRQDVWIVSSSQTVEGLKITPSTNTNINREISIDFKVVKAMETIEYNDDSVKQYKTRSLVGENNNGFLSYRPDPSIENSPELKKKLTGILSEVNESRLILMLEVINRNEELTTDDLDKVKKTFAEMNQKNALKGEWVQLEDDEWIKKE
ncbi:MAG: DUF1318 domain-containing protein [bacterium]|nr:DUF1318 domain-containing protein [bacterium]